jgi:hypothetical protein
VNRFLWLLLMPVLLACSGGSTDATPAQAPASTQQATPAETATVASAVFIATATPTVVPALPDRVSCDEIRGNEYRSASEAQWFQDNCATPVNAGQPVSAPPPEQNAAAPPAPTPTTSPLLSGRTYDPVKCVGGTLTGSANAKVVCGSNPYKPLQPRETPIAGFPVLFSITIDIPDPTRGSISMNIKITPPGKPSLTLQFPDSRRLTLPFVFAYPPPTFYALAATAPGTYMIEIEWDSKVVATGSVLIESAQ